MKNVLKIGMVVALFLLIGAASASASEYVLEGESMNEQSYYGVASYAPTYVTLYTNGFVYSNIDLPEETDTIVITTSSDYYHGYPYMKLYIDNALVFQGYIESTDWIDISLDRVVSSGDHYLRAYFTNDHYSRGVGDRNLKIDKITFKKNSITADIEINPDTFNLKSKGKWVTAYIETPDYDVSQIDVSTILLDGTISAESKPTGIGDHDEDGIEDLMVKFDRVQLENYLSEGLDQGQKSSVELTITGTLDGTPFEGVDEITVMNK